MKSIMIAALCLLPAGIMAQPKWTKKAKKSLVEIVTRDKDGLVLQRRAGFIATADGSVLTTYDQLPQAHSVEIVAADGKTYQPGRVLAADAMMDFVLFTSNVKKPVPLTAASTSAQQGEEVFVFSTSSCQTDTIINIETVKEQPYYSTASSHSALGAPLMTADGEVLGMLHASDDKGSYAVSMATVQASCPSAITAVGRTYADLPIPVTLPADEEQARTFVFLSSKADSARYMTHIDDYITAFPSHAFGYTTKGEYLVQHGDTLSADEVYALGQNTVTAKDELHYSHSLALYNNQKNLPQALALCEEAIAANPLPLYQHHRAMVLYSLQRYSEAAEGFEAIGQTNMRSPQAFVYAFQSRRMAGDSVDVCLALLDSAVACYTKPYPTDAATTLLLRATTRAEAKLWRPAVADYNEYEHLCAGHVNAEFYFRRFIAEANGRMYQQALDDLDRAITLAPQEAELYAQKALLFYRLGHKEDALEPARKAIEIDASWADELKEILE